MLVAVGAVLITLGTVASTHEAAAVVGMAVVGFVLLFAGIASPAAAAATTAALLTFVLPVAVAQPTSAIGPRLLGWAIAAAFAVPTCLLVWPAAWHDDLRRRIASALSAVADLALVRAEGGHDPAAEAAMTAEVTGLRAQFQATPYPPLAATGTAVALSKLVGRVEWVADNAALTGDPAATPDPGPVREVVAGVAATLRHCSALVCDASGHPVDDPTLVDTVRASTERLDGLIAAELACELSVLVDPEAEPEGTPDGGGDRPRLDPSFRARTMGLTAEMVADSTLEASGAQAVGDRRLGPSATPEPRLVWPRLTSHLSFRSVWFRNSLRGAAGLAAAVAVVEVTDVEHGFWVVLGALSVLRSNALGTGATAARAIAGTTLGFVIGALIMIGVGGHTTLLWFILPVAVLVAGAAPSMISFTAGQAGFTVMVVVLFNIIDPEGWKVGLTRIEDIALGCAVSVVVGLLFWPRGATAALGRALADAFTTSSDYLAAAVQRLTISTHPVDTEAAQRESHRAYLRLDDAFRQFLVERGAKTVPVETLAHLATGSNRIRLAAYTLAQLPRVPVDAERPELESVAVAGAVLRDAYADNVRWYERFAADLAGHGPPLDPPPVLDGTLDDVLRAAFDDARAARRGDRLQVVLRMVWADELLATQHGWQADLADSAGLFARGRRRGV